MNHSPLDHAIVKVFSDRNRQEAKKLVYARSIYSISEKSMSKSSVDNLIYIGHHHADQAIEPRPHRMHVHVIPRPGIGLLRYM